MANTKISALTANTNPNGNEELVYAYNNANGKMSLNTMKTFATTWTQPELVSGTNIKTINHQSILWAWNIDIQWGWGGGWSSEYDAIVDASGQGDYTTIGAAVDANKRNIFVRNGTYNETQWHFVDMLGADALSIVWESKAGVVVNISLTEVPTQWAETYNHPAFLFLNFNATTNWSFNVSNITFNPAINTSQIVADIFRFKTAANNYNDANVNNCAFYAVNGWSERAFFEIIWFSSGSQTPMWAWDIVNCDISVTSNTANLLFESWDEARNEMVVFKNCDIVAKANSSNRWHITISKWFDCNIRYVTAWMWEVRLEWNHLYNCYIDTWTNLGSSVVLDVQLSEIRDCEIHSGHSGSFNPKKAVVSSVMPERAASTAYSLGDQVIRNWTYYTCNTAHTSSADWYDDEDNWDTMATVRLRDMAWCTLYTWDTIQLWWIVQWNNLNMNNHNWDILISQWSIMKWNILDWADYNRNIYVDNQSIIDWNIFDEWRYLSSTIKYASTHYNIIVNNIILDPAISISKIGSWTKTIVDNNNTWYEA